MAAARAWVSSGELCTCRVAPGHPAAGTRAGAATGAFGTAGAFCAAGAFGTAGWFAAAGGAGWFAAGGAGSALGAGAGSRSPGRPTVGTPGMPRAGTCAADPTSPLLGAADGIAGPAFGTDPDGPVLSAEGAPGDGELVGVAGMAFGRGCVS
ncbi:hypothetical protein GCM10023321_58220 [Pseudonocardia eucalypti]|uniref:Uncharacterized protein n=1 Tax=Pseudonocardia eucalypti TaxID=648755 RepID=A0ABP9QS99_9PSEU|nr:hypothetical protein [Pseudonocardia eucalypti]